MSAVRQIVKALAAERKDPVALATVVRTHGSSYRRSGAQMLIGFNLRLGALSGGCLEDEIGEHAFEVIASGVPKLLSFDTQARFGCNGSIEVFLERILPENTIGQQLSEGLARREMRYLATVFEANDAQSLGTHVLASGMETDLFTPEELDNAAASGVPIQVSREERSVLLAALAPPIRLLVIGDGPDSRPLATFARELGWEPLVFPEGLLPWNEIALDDRTVAVIETHNFGKDAKSLKYLLPQGLKYIGLLGPKKRREQLISTLLENAEVQPEHLDRLFGPAGLDIGAETPEEIALSIVAEIQAALAGRGGGSLRQRKGAIHDPLRQVAVELTSVAR